jgi:aspartyl-tRNA(Asn)/glutamyl-tRNA(Gln) amidotransferase subunit C
VLGGDRVLHVARLARLELIEQEVQLMSGELSTVLGYMERIGELGDLAGVEPTAYVMAVQNALRADEPARRWRRRSRSRARPTATWAASACPVPGAGAGMSGASRRPWRRCRSQRSGPPAGCV